MMKTEFPSSNFHSVFLAGNIFFAGVEVSGVLEYVLRVALGTAFISAVKYASDRLQRRKKKKETDARLNRIRSRRSKRVNNGIGE